MSREAMFTAIEKVMSARVSKMGRYSVSEKIIDVLSAAPEPMSCREVKLVLIRLGQIHSQSTVGNSMGDLADLGKVELTGRAKRKIRTQTQTVALYKVTKADG